MALGSKSMPWAKSKGADKSRAEQEKDRLKRQAGESLPPSSSSANSSPGSRSGPSSSSKPLTPVQTYLLAYNVLSALAWSYLLFLTLSHLTRHLPPAPATAAWWSRLLGKGSPLPAPLTRALERLSGGYHHRHLGWWTKVIQTFAIVEVGHAALGWTKSGLVSTGIQVWSRLYTVWGIVEARPDIHNSPLFITMLLAWSVTEVVRYSYYATSILGVEVPPLTWLRYSLFYVLYPLGASSEAFLAFSTLPPLSTLPFIPKGLLSVKPLSNLILSLPAPIRRWIAGSNIGTMIVWSLASSSVKAKTAVSQKWHLADYTRFVIFLFWWPVLVQLMTIVSKQRRRVLGKGRKVVGGANKAN